MAARDKPSQAPADAKGILARGALHNAGGRKMHKSLLFGREALVVAAAVLLALSAAQAQVRDNKGPVATLHGGVGAHAREAMERERDQFNLRLQFALRGSGAYLADVRVRIADAKGKTVVDTTSSGPWFFAQLPQGRYEVTASSNGQSQTQALDITKGWRGWVFRFDPPPAP
jgi:hypothetical protein